MEDTRIQIEIFKDKCNWCKNNNMTCEECTRYKNGSQERPCPRNVALYQLIEIIREDERRKIKGE